MSKVIKGISLFVSTIATTLFAATAPMQLVNLSPQIGPATVEDDFGSDYTLHVSTYPDQGVNLELGVAADEVPYSHQSYFILNNEIFFIEPIIMEFVIDVPSFFTTTGIADVNNNGVPDFYDFNASFEGTEYGICFPPGQQPFEFEMTFFREAGTPNGGCIIYLPPLGLRFQTWFTIVRHAGEYTYTRTGQVLDGSVSLAWDEDVTDTLNGPFDLTVTSNTKLDYPLTGTWTAPESTSITYVRAGSLTAAKGNFVGIMGFQDGRWNTPWEDYPLAFAIIPATDGNSNGTPDLLDGGGGGGPTVNPTLAAVRTANGVELTITGEAGITYTVLSSMEVDAPAAAWTIEQTVTLVGTTGTVTFATNGERRFFRLKG